MVRAKRILLVEDEPGLVLTLTDRLELEGYTVIASSDGDEAVEKAGGEPFDLLVLDVMLPGKSGLEICRTLRENGISTPILFLTARGEISDKVIGLKLGGDDYLTKPFDMLELTARVDALMRRNSLRDKTGPGGFQFGEIEIDFRKAEVIRDGELVELSALEFKLLRYFIENRGATLSRDELLNRVWGYESMPYSRTVDVHVSGLRQKIEENPSRHQYLVTVHRLGYKFVG